MARINLYHQGRHTVVIDGIPYTGFAEGDFLEVKVDGGNAERTKGGDGPAMNIAVAQGGEILISLNPVSPLLGELYALFESQATTPRMFTIALITGVEETIVATGCALGEMPNFVSGGPVQQPRQFNFQCLKIKYDTSGIEAVAGGFVGGLLGS